MVTRVSPCSREGGKGSRVLQDETPYAVMKLLFPQSRCTGHVMYEMSYGRELNELTPQEDDYSFPVPEQREQLEEIIAYIFDKKSQSSFKQVSGLRRIIGTDSKYWGLIWWSVPMCRVY
jgi:hypothetical protein